MADLQVVIRALNQASTELRRVAGDIGKLDRAAAQAGSGAAKANAGFAKFGAVLNATGLRSSALGQELGLLTAGTGRIGVAATGAAVGVGLLAGGLAASLRASINFEASIVKVAKTAGFTAAETKEFSDEILAMSRRLPVATSGLTEIAAVAGQLGIAGPKNIAVFTEEVAKLASTTGVAAAELATSLGTIAQVSRLPISEIHRLSAAITELGNTSNSTEAQILDITTRLVGVGSALDVPIAALTGIASAVAAVTGDVEASATAVQRTFLGIFDAAQKGGDELQVFADVAGLTQEQFRELALSHPEQAFAAFVEGLEDVENITEALDALDLSDVRVTKTLLSLAQSAIPVSKTIDDANRAALDATATNEEFARSSETTAAKIQILKNNVNALAVNIGDEFRPQLNAALDELNDFAGALDDTEASAEAAANAIRLLINPIGLMRTSITDTEETWGASWNAMVGVTETAVNSILSAIENMIQGLGAGISELRSFASKIPGARSVLDEFGLDEDLAARLAQFELGRANFPRFGGESEEIGDPAFAVARQREESRRLGLDGDPKREIGIPDDGKVRTVLDALSDGIIDLGEAIALGLSESQVIALELADAEGEAANEAFRARIEFLKLGAIMGRSGLTGEAFQLQLALGAIAENMRETNRTASQFRLEEFVRPELDRLRSALQDVLGAPTRETLGLQLQRAQLERRRLLILQGGASSDDPRVKAIDRELDGLNNLIRLRESEVEIMRIRAQLADASIATDRDQVTQTQILTAAIAFTSVEFANLRDVVALEALAQINLMNAANEAAAALRGIPVVNARASGGPTSGLTLVGERGPELFDAGSGGRVIDAFNTRRLLNAGTPAPNYTMQIYVTANTKNDAEEIARVVEERLVRAQRQSDRRGHFVMTGGGFP